MAVKTLIVLLIAFVTQATADSRLDDLRSLISRNHLTSGFKRADDNTLTKFLAARNYNVYQAFDLIQNYIRFRHLHPEAFMSASDAVQIYKPPMFYVQNETTPSGEVTTTTVS